jgi:pimeloyl-ACP methyl ester carboxylesterase
VADRLRSSGHEVHPVTLTGLGDRAALASPEIDLERHVADIVAAIEEGDLRDVVLFGHSYGGIPVTGAADRIPEGIATAVYVDSGPALDGSQYIEMLPPPLRDATERHVAEEGDGWRRPMPSWEELETVNGAGLQGLDDQTRHMMRERATPPTVRDLHPADRPAERGEDESPARPGLVQLPTRTGEGIHRERTPWFAELGGPQWSFVELPTSHWPMIFASETLLEPPSAPNSPRTRRHRGE